MLQILVYGFLAVLFLLALLELILRSCVKNETGTWRRCVVISAPVQSIRNRLQGIKTLKEETEQETNRQTDIQVGTV